MSVVDERILILTSTQKDSESTRKLLSQSNFHPFTCENFEDVLKNMAEGAGVLLLAKEVLSTANLQKLTENLNQQESWSDLPIIILASAGDLAQGNVHTVQVLKHLRNTTILERPVRVATLISIMESAIANRRRQYEVRKLVKELVEARKEAELSKIESDRANQTKSEFLANMSHEIRTPLGVILGFTDLILEADVSGEERKKYFGTIQRNGKLLLELVNDVLDLAKVEAGRIAVEKIETSVADLLKDIILGLKPVAATKDVEVTLEIQKDFPRFVMTDPTRVRQIFMNVLGNAVKFTKQGSISSKVSFSKIDKNLLEICVVVADTGLGISPAQMKKIFQPFSQADSSMTRQFGGTGLGLVLSRKLAEALDGDLKLLESQIGIGSKFEISFNAEIVDSKFKTLKETAGAQPLKEITGSKVLLVEDSVDNQFIISRILNQAGVQVELANNGIEAIEKASTADFDVIFMDIQMPFLDGNEAMKSLRQRGYKKPIVALTANALKGDKENALSSGFDGYITKPIQRNDLYESLSKFHSR